MERGGLAMNELFDDVGSEEAIRGAEDEMRALAAELFDSLVLRLAEHVPRHASPDEKRHVVEGLIDADPDLHDMTERLAVINLFCGDDRR